MDFDPVTKKRRMIHPRHVDAWEKCRIVEIAWSLYDTNGALIKNESFIIKPVGFSIPVEASNVHGISTQQALDEGIDIAHALNCLKDSLRSTNIIVAHNMKFDYNVILSEMHRLHDNDMIHLWTTRKSHCTMLAALKPGMKWPKLSELYLQLFKRPPNVNLHRALDDVSVCAEIYFHSRGMHVE